MVLNFAAGFIFRKCLQSVYILLNIPIGNNLLRRVLQLQVTGECPDEADNVDHNKRDGNTVRYGGILHSVFYGRHEVR